MQEQQNIEFKQSWHNNYLKWICGFANAQGGTIFIGKDDDGNIVDVADYKNLMDEIPNKIRNTMGISVNVNLLEKEGKHFIEIVTQPYSVPISLRGRYYYRSGSTKQELTGISLNEFLMKKSGKTWDDVIEPRASINDIDAKSVAIYLRSSENAGRLPEDKGLTLSELLEKLRLTESGKIKRAAIILFGKDPAKFYPNTFIKIGYFDENDIDIKFQETEEGNLIILLQAVLNQLNHKFLKRAIEFEGIHRIEISDYPIAAIREMLLNALVHRNYMGAPIQLRVYDDKINIWNEGLLPNGLSLSDLKQPHSSRPRNPVIADIAFKGGYIDAWGRGTIKIIDACKKAELPEPEMNEQNGGFIVTLFKTKSDNFRVNEGVNEGVKQLFDLVEKKPNNRAPYYAKELQTSVKNVERWLKQLKDEDKIEFKGSSKTGGYHTK